VFYKQALDLPIIQANSTLCAQFNPQAKKMMEALSVNRHLTDQITGVLINKYHGNDPGVETVARELAMSIRTLYLMLNISVITVLIMTTSLLIVPIKISIFYIKTALYIICFPSHQWK